jgi:hypothetical protein
VVLASYALSALFRVARAHGEPITCELGYGEPAVYKQPVDESLIEANNWITAFFLGLIRRDNETLNELCLTSADDLRRSSTRHPEYRYLFANALRAHWLRDRKTTKYLLGAIKAANPKTQKFHNEKHVRDIDVPLMQLFLCILSEDSRIEEKAIDAIKLHKGYWGASSRRDDRIGFISIGLTAMLSLADRRGLTVHIESDYTPSRLVTRDFTDMSE